MQAPQVIVVCLLLAKLAIELALHGQKVASNYNFYKQLLATSVMFALLIWGGFFT